jgi:enamine deaminase RidA (YjgF/YER057c/UK114 family)
MIKKFFQNLNNLHFILYIMRKIFLLFISTLLLSIVINAQDAETKLKEKGIVLIPPSNPVANYVNAVRVGNLLYLAGKGPSRADNTYITGKVGKDLTIEQGYEAARLTAINHLAVIKNELGSLNKVKRIVKVLGMVNCTEDFKDQPKVINGYSDLMVEIFGDKGKHARSAVGMYALPFNMAVEVEVIVEIELNPE